MSDDYGTTYEERAQIAEAELARLRGEVGELRAWQREAAGYLTQVRDTLAASGRVRHLHVDALLARVKP